MNKKTKIMLALALGMTMSASALTMSACDNPFVTMRLFGKEPITAVVDPAKQVVLAFVAADGSAWDKEYSFDQDVAGSEVTDENGEKDKTVNHIGYHLSVELRGDKKVVLKGVASKSVQQQHGVPGQCNRVTWTIVSEEQAPEAETEALGFEQELGTWSEEAGYGYKIVKDDTTTYINFDTIMGRHYFYTSVSNGDTSFGKVRLEAKDAVYASTLASDYAIHEIRHGSYYFVGGSESGSNLSSTYLYLLNDGTATMLSGASNSLTYTDGGTWTEDAARHVLTVHIGNNTYTSSGYCDAQGKEGYRMTVSGTVCYATTAADWDYGQYTDVDFDGEEIGRYVSTDGTYTLVLTSKGVANLYQGTAKKNSFSYTKEDDVYTIGTAVSTEEEGVTKITLTWQEKSGDGPCAQTQDVSKTFVLAQVS